MFFTATACTLGDVPKQKPDFCGFIGETEAYRVHLHYVPDKDWLQGNNAALTEAVDDITAANKGKKGCWLLLLPSS